MTPPILAVRVQDDLHGAYVNEQGHITLAYHKESTRNTAHFSLNSITADINGYGAFNEYPDGSLKGKIVFITPLNEMKPPAGLNQIDTWFRFNVDQKQQQTLELGGSAMVIVPEGTIVPEGMRALYYDGTIEGRDNKVAEYIDSQGVKLEYAQARNWAGHSQASAQQWAQEVKTQLYGPESSIHIGSHDGSLDQELERCTVKGLIENFKKERLYKNEYGTEHDYVDVINERAQEHSRTLTTFIQTCPQSDKNSIPFYEQCLEQLDQHIAQAITINNHWEHQHMHHLKEKLIQDLHQLPGTGDIFVLTAGNSTPQGFTVETFSDGLLSENFANNSKFWRAGHCPQWEDQYKFGLHTILTDNALKLPRPPTNVEQVLGITKASEQETLAILSAIRQQTGLDIQDVNDLKNHVQQSGDWTLG